MSCSCGEEHKEDMKKPIIRIAVAVIIVIIGVILEHQTDGLILFTNPILKLAFYLVAYLIVGYEVLLNAFKRIIKLEAMDETVLMSIATIGAFILGDYQEAVAVMVFYQIGELFQDYSMDKSRDSIKELVDITPEFANVLRNEK